MGCLLSVIVPVYKVEAYLPRCVDSILAQSYQNLQVILVDDGSPDGCGNICEEYAARDSRVEVIHKKNGGLSSARNAGLDIARGEYIAFVDSDDWIEPNTYAEMLAMAEQEGVKLVCAGRYDVDGETGQKEKGLCPPKREVISGEDLVKRIFTWDNIDSAAWDKLYHRTLFENQRYPEGKIVEDVPVTYLIALEAGQAGMLDMPVYNYFHREGSITTAAVSDKTFHFVHHTERIFQTILEKFPSLLQEACYLRVRALMYTMLTLESSSAALREKYAGEYTSARKALRKHMGFLLKSPLIKKKERIIALTLTAGIYRPAQRFYHVLKHHEA